MTPSKQLKVSTVRAANRAEPSIISVEVKGQLVVFTGGGGHALVLATTDGKTFVRRRPPGNQGLRGAKFIGDELWITGEYGTFAVSRDRGETWEDVDVAMTGRKRFTACLWDVARDVKGQYWAAGSDGALLRGKGRKFKPVTHKLKSRDERADPRVETVPAGVLLPVFNALWDGKALVKPKGLTGANAALATASTTGTIIVVGDHGAALRSLDGGKTFKAVKTGVTTHLNDVAFVAGGFIAVGAHGKMLRSEDDGQTWKAMPSKVKVELWSIGSWGNGAFVGAEHGQILRIDAPGDTYWKGAVDDLGPKPVVTAKITPLRAPSADARDQRFAALHAEAVAAHAKLAKKPRHAYDASILEALDDADTYGVSADALQTAGDPRGVLIALQIANPKSKDAAKLLKQHPAALLGPLSGKGYALDWRWGYIVAARLENPHGDDWFEDDAEEADTIAMLATLLDHPSARYLQRLTLGIMGFEGNGYDGELKELGKAALPALRHLKLGDFSGEETEISWSDIGDMTKAYGALGNLEELILRSGKMKLGTIVLPQLKLLAIITGGFSKANLASIEKALLPSLETLTLTFGAERYGCDVAPKDLRKLLASDRFPRLTRLGLANAGFADELAEMLHTSSLVAQVTALDLSMGTLSDTGAYRIATYAAGYAHLEELDVSDSYLSKRGIALLKKALPNTEIDASNQRLREGREFEDRYVAISE